MSKMKEVMENIIEAYEQGMYESEIADVFDVPLEQVIYVIERHFGSSDFESDFPALPEDYAV